MPSPPTSEDRAEDAGPALPWQRRAPAKPAVFAQIWTTGEDTGTDVVVRLLAMRSDPLTGWAIFDRVCRPLGEEPSGEASKSGLEESLSREFGLSAQELADAESVSEAWPAFITFLRGAPVVCADALEFVSWCEHIEGRRGSAPNAVGLTQLAGLLFPGHASQGGAELVHAALEAAGHDPAGSRADITPVALQLALAALVVRFLECGRALVRVAAVGYARAYAQLAGVEEAAAHSLACALDLVEHTSTWSKESSGMPVAPAALVSGCLSAAWEEDIPAEDLLYELAPGPSRVWRPLLSEDPLPATTEQDTPFTQVDLELVDDIFEEHLPALFMTGKHDSQPATRKGEAYRESQHTVAREVARTLGSDELLLVHAPTGTGKTLAYLIPALLWARRHGVRVGIATYTRALQEQAMDREVPYALAALARAGLESGFRVSVLKGRENYVCWRALRLAAPGESDDGEAWLAWTALALFALTDTECDLDRFPKSAPLPLESARTYAKAISSLLRAARARSGCCTRKEDRGSCGAELARRRAERCHVVITNQSFALARQEFFRHVIFDECEHLHDQAHNAWSHNLGFSETRRMLERLYAPDRSYSRAPLDRLERQVIEGSPAHRLLQNGIDAWHQCGYALQRLEQAALAFDEWRQAARQNRGTQDEHSLLREFIEGGEAGELIRARLLVAQQGNALDRHLAEICEDLERMPVRSTPRIRRSLDLARADLAETLSALENWLPIDEGEPRFRKETFYDIEMGTRGEPVLCARVLLPNEYLGRHYYPELANATFLSATTWLKGSFSAAKAYLGLDRAAEPLEFEEREGRKVRTFRSPEAFDYGRVLICIPRDAPHVSRAKQAFLAYARRFMTWLAERTQGRVLALFTNLADVAQLGREMEGFFRARNIPFWYQGMPGIEKEQLADLFRSRPNSVLMGVDTFWYGADFPGETLEYLVLVKLPYGVPDRYHHAQCAALGRNEQWRRIYLPRSLAKFRQGFGRLMRRSTDKGCVFILDNRILEPRHRGFLKELPISSGGSFVRGPDAGQARVLRGDSQRCLRAALEHMQLLEDVAARGLDLNFGGDSAQDAQRESWVPRPAGRDMPGLSESPGDNAGKSESTPEPVEPTLPKPPPLLDISSEDLPF